MLLFEGLKTLEKTSKAANVPFLKAEIGATSVFRSL